METLRKIRLFLSSPSDITSERHMVREIVNQLNENPRRKVQVELIEQSVVKPGFSETAQSKINSYFNNIDIYVGIIGGKLGTPTKEYESGTVEEFNLALKERKGKEILLYFINETKKTKLEIDRITEFKRKISDEGFFYSEYPSKYDFQKNFRNHLEESLNNLTSNTRLQMQKSNEEDLNNPNVDFSHSMKETITLDDIYVSPIYSELTNKKQTEPRQHDTNKLLKDILDSKTKTHVIVGKESSGKSTTAKKLCSLAYANYELIPVRIKGESFSKSISAENITSIIKKAIVEQYVSELGAEQPKAEDLIIIIDDFSKSCKGKSEYWDTFLNELSKHCAKIIILGSRDLLITIPGGGRFANCKLYEITELTIKKCLEIIDKWHRIGKDAEIEDLGDSEETEHKINECLTFIKENIKRFAVPRYPIYILTLLQALEMKSNKNNDSTHGYYFQLIIHSSIKKGLKDEDMFSFYTKFMATYCYYLFQTRKKYLTESEFENFTKDYSIKKDTIFSKNTIINDLTATKLVKFDEKSNCFPKEKYIYYYYVAHELANRLNEDSIKQTIAKMCSRLFCEEYSNVILILPYLSKDKFLITKLIEQSKVIFSDYQPAKLTKSELVQFNNSMKNVPEIVYEDLSSKKYRDAEVEQYDEEEKQEIESKLAKYKSPYDEISLDDDISGIDYFAKVTNALKTIDIIGQVLVKNWGDFDKEEKINVVISSYDLGLRTLSSYISYIKENSNVFSDIIKEIVREKYLKDQLDENLISKREIQLTSNEFVSRIIYIASSGIISRIASSLCSNKLIPTFQKVLEKHEDVASVKLIDISVKLGYTSLDNHLKSIIELNKSLDQNILCELILKNIVLRNLYLFNTIKHQTKTTVCNNLKIEMKHINKIPSSNN